MKLRVPSKHFVLGEYLALMGMPALVVAVEPDFVVGPRLNLEVPLIGQNQGHLTLNENSPAGIFLKRLGNPQTNLAIQKSVLQEGSGQSTAEFLWAWADSLSVPEGNLMSKMWEIHEAYLASQLEGSQKPSGYDLLAQIAGGWSWCDFNQKKVHSSQWPFQACEMHFFKTPKKVKTHEHLNELRKISNLGSKMREGKEIVEAAQESWLLANPDKFSNGINKYAEWMQAQGWVCEETLLLRSSMLAAGAIAAKGCGALGADVLLVIVPAPDFEPKSEVKGSSVSDRKCRVFARAKELDLKWIASHSSACGGAEFLPEQAESESSK